MSRDEPGLEQPEVFHFHTGYPANTLYPVHTKSGPCRISGLCLFTIFLIQGITEMSPDDPDVLHVEVLHPLRPLLLSVEVSGWDPDPTEQNDHKDPGSG